MSLVHGSQLRSCESDFYNTKLNIYIPRTTGEKDITQTPQNFEFLFPPLTSYVSLKEEGST